MQHDQDSYGGDGAGKRRPWGCVVACAGEVVALAVGFYYGAQKATTNPHNAVLGAAEIEGLVYATAFGLGWPVVCLLAVVTWRAIRALDRWQNRVKP